MYNPLGGCLRILSGGLGIVSRLAFSPDGTLLASATDSSDGTPVRVWDLQDGSCRVLEGHSGSVVHVAFSPDGRFLASASDFNDYSVRVWDLQDGSCRVLEGHLDRIHDVAFSPEGNLLASASDDMTVRVWDLETEKTIKRFRFIKNIDLSGANFEKALIPEKDKEMLKETGAKI